MVKSAKNRSETKSLFLMQYFCLHGILWFSKSYPEIESTWPTAKCRGRKSFDTLYYIVTCATFCVSFSSKLKANVFPKHILKLKARDQSIQERKKLFCQVIVKNYLCNVKVFDQNWKHVEARNQRTAPQLTLLYRDRTVRSSHQRCCL